MAPVSPSSVRPVRVPLYSQRLLIKTAAGLVRIARCTTYTWPTFYRVTCPGCPLCEAFDCRGPETKLNHFACAWSDHVCEQNRGFQMKNTFLAVVVLMFLAACATSQGPASGDADASATNSSETTGRKKVCKYERSSGTGSGMERVCRYVDAG